MYKFSRAAFLVWGQWYDYPITDQTFPDYQYRQINLVNCLERKIVRTDFMGCNVPGNHLPQAYETQNDGWKLS